MKQKYGVYLLLTGMLMLACQPVLGRRLSEIFARKRAEAPPQQEQQIAPPEPEPTPAVRTSRTKTPKTLPASKPATAKPATAKASAPKSLNIEDVPKEVNKPTPLQSHGVGKTTKDLIQFLEKGIPQKQAGAIPDEPQEKCQLAIDAMAILGGKRSTDAVPVLSRIASIQFPQGVESLLEMDLAKTAPETRVQFRDTASRLLQYNAVNALGLIGDPGALPVVRSVFQQETNAAARIQYALCLGSLGDATGLPFLVEQIERQNRRESAAAAKVFKFITGQDFDYSENTALRARRAKSKQYRDWLRQNQQSFSVNPDAVIERRLAQRTQPPYQPRSTRDLLKIAAMYFDIDGSFGSRDARKRLQGGGPSLNPELQRIASDLNEDLDVRMEAMNWYFENNRSDARTLLQKLRRDENPEIADKANTLIDQIERELQGPVAGLAYQ